MNTKTIKVSELPDELGKELPISIEILKTNEYFGKYGNIDKVDLKQQEKSLHYQAIVTYKN